MRSKFVRFAILPVLVSGAWAATPKETEFFEAKIRPVLAKNCYPCHSSASKLTMNGLSLESAASVLRGGTNGPAVVPGKPDESPLIRAVRYEGRKMPPSGQLPANVIADLEKWVAMGAPDPRDGKAATYKAGNIDIEKGRQFWAFQPPVKVAPPKVKNAKWVSDPLDRFILQALERKHLTPAIDADRATWLRRVTFDLTGLPPSPTEIDNFQQDRSRKAYERVVDRLLASERFGERWGRHWLDVARYAESEGRGRNFPFPFAWRYRDYVIDALNHDKPFDQFVREQIAGDLLPASDEKRRNQQLIATGFLALGSHDLLELNPATFRMDVVDEQINATSRSFMGLTVGCARCHDHKFDPVPTADYYALAGIFRSTEMLSGLQRRPRDNTSYFNIGLLARLDAPAGESRPEFLPPEKLEKWESLQTQLAGLLEAPRKGMGNKKNGGAPILNGQKLRELTRPIMNELDQYPLPPDLVMAVREAEKPADCEIHIRGEVTELGPQVPRGVVQVASKPGDHVEVPRTQSGRLQLAEWITRRDHPLTARVAVNRIWQHMFGRGLVGSVDNFGATGERPTHPELLDYLAVRFMDQGWSMKKTIREIALSRTYRQSAAYSARNAKIDPDNRLLWRANRRRLEIEAIRDSLLQISGRLDLRRPEASPVLTFRRAAEITPRRGGRGGPEDYAVELRNRSVYVPVLRNATPQMYDTFDFPEPSETKGERDVTTVATQALFLLNSQFVLAQAHDAARKLVAGGPASPEARIALVYREVLGRAPKADEAKRALEYLTGQENADDQAAWSRLYQALFASAEFRYRS